MNCLTNCFPNDTGTHMMDTYKSHQLSALWDNYSSITWIINLAGICHKFLAWAKNSVLLTPDLFLEGKELWSWDETTHSCTFAESKCAIIKLNHSILLKCYAQSQIAVHKSRFLAKPFTNASVILCMLTPSLYILDMCQNYPGFASYE